VATRLNTPPLMSLIVCVILTITFTILIISKSSDIRRFREGDPDKSTWPSIEKLRTTVKTSQQEIQNYRDTIAQDQRILYELDLQGNVRRLYYSDGELLGPVSTPGATEGPVRGNQVKYKVSNWELLRDLISMDTKYLDGLRASDEGDDRQTFPSLDDAIKNRQDQLKAVVKATEDAAAEFTADRDHLVAKRDELQTKRNKIDARRHTDESARLTRITQLEAKIRQLLELELHWMVDRDVATGKVIGLAGLEPEGRVLQTDVQGGRVVIDKGAKDKIFPGLIFEIFNYVRGAYISKGRIEVIEVQEGISVCRVLGQADAKRDPISRQDYIGNPVFNAERPRVFVVAGDFKRYNKEDLEGFIRRTGGIVWPQLAPGADYLVAGDRSEQAQIAARQYQILAMHEDDLLQYVQTTFAPLGGLAADRQPPVAIAQTPAELAPPPEPVAPAAAPPPAAPADAPAAPAAPAGN
jgi:hypothetical protein